MIFAGNTFIHLRPLRNCVYNFSVKDERPEKLKYAAWQYRNWYLFG
jgi:hypothetical protein